MKKKLTLMIAVVLAVTLFTGTVALAGNGNNAPGMTQDRLQYMDQIRDQIEEVLANRSQIAALRGQLVELREQTRDHLQELKNNPDGVTDTQLEAAQSIADQIKAAREAMNATNGDMRQTRQELRTARRNRDYEGMITAYNAVIKVQEQRIQQLQKLVELHKQAIAL